MNTVVAQNLLSFEFQSPKRENYNPKPKYLKKDPSFSHVRNLNERIETDSENSEQGKHTFPIDNEENLSVSPESKIQKIPQIKPAYVNKPHDYFAQLRKEIGITYDVRPSQRTRASNQTSYMSPRRRNPGEGIVSRRMRGQGSGAQANRIGLGFSRITSQSPNHSPRYLSSSPVAKSPRYLSPNSVKKEYFNAAYNYFSTEFCDKAHISGLLQQVKSLEEENERLKSTLEKRKNQIKKLD